MDVYGFSGTELAPIAQALELNCRIHFVKHDSSFRGGDYFRGTVNGRGQYNLQRNFLDDEDEFAEDGHPECFAILYASDESNVLNSVRERICSPEVGGKFLARR